MSDRRAELRGSGVDALRVALRSLAETNRWPLLEPLPATRFLGDSFGVSNASAHRVLSSLCDSGHLWRAANGRFHLPAARRFLDRPLPLACLLRRFEQWTEVSREIMRGVDETCGDLNTAMLLVHDRVLFRQSAATSPARIGDARELRTALEDFLIVHGDRTGGVVLDEIWPDPVLTAFRAKLRRAVVVYRRTSLQSIGNVYANAASAARLSVDFAKARKFDRLAILLAYTGYHPSEESAAAIIHAAHGHYPKPKAFNLHSNGGCSALVRWIQDSAARTLVLCTEDNAAAVALAALRTADVPVPEQAGLLSLMGSPIAVAHQIPAFGFPFQEIGRQAARMAISGPLDHVAVEPVFAPGSTA